MIGHPELHRQIAADRQAEVARRVARSHVVRTAQVEATPEHELVLRARTPRLRRIAAAVRAVVPA